MKKTILFLGTILMAAMSAQAQSLWDTSKPDQRFTFGIRAGINFASSNVDEATSTLTAGHAGISVDYHIIKSFSLSSGVFYVGKGFRGNYPELTQSTETADYTRTQSKLTASYLQVPLLASWRIEAPSGVQFHINAGPYVAYGIGGSAVYKPYDMTFAREYNQDAFGDKGFWRHLDYGACVGINVLIGHVVAGVSYDFGLADVARVYDTFHTRNVSMTVGYNF